MSYRDMARRIEALEQAQPPADDGESFVVDIGGTGPARYWIDGHEVSESEFRRRGPDGPFYVDIGDDNEHE